MIPISRTCKKTELRVSVKIKVTKIPRDIFELFRRHVLKRKNAACLDRKFMSLKVVQKNLHGTSNP